LRNSPFGKIVGPLFETGERIHQLSNNMDKNSDTFIPITDDEINKLETINNIKDLNEDCSICLERLNKSDIPEFKYMLDSLSINQIKLSLYERGIR